MYWFPHSMNCYVHWSCFESLPYSDLWGRRIHTNVVKYVHIYFSHPDFPQELCLKECSRTLLPAHILQLVLGCKDVLWKRVCVSRGASPDVHWSPLVFGKQHIHSQPDFPQELGSTASSITLLPAHILQLVLGCQELWVGIGVLKTMNCYVHCWCYEP